MLAAGAVNDTGSGVPRPVLPDWRPPKIGRLRRLTAGLRLLPDFMIIGTQRGGTTSLYRYLCTHPAIATAHRKEVHYFDHSYAAGLAHYRAFFPLAAQRAWTQQVLRRPYLTGEASPYYLYHPLVPGRVHQLTPEARFIALLRNPVDRALSHYQMICRRGWEELSFEDALDREEERLYQDTAGVPEAERYSDARHRFYSYAARGRYAEQLERWLAVFPRKQLLVMSSEQFYANPPAAVNRVLEFLGLPTAPTTCEKQYNKAEYSKMPPETRRRLTEYFAPHNERLFSLLGERFDWDESR